MLANKTFLIKGDQMDIQSGFFVDDNAIKCREPRRGGYWDRVIVPKEIFIEAYNKWIKNDENNYVYPVWGDDDADDWSED